MMHRLGTIALLLVAPAAVGARSASDTMDRHGHRAVPPSANAVHQTAGTPARGLPDWMALGPFGGDIQDVNASPTNPNIVLAGLAPGGSSGGSMYRSTDGGATWTIVPQLATLSVYDIEFNAAGAAYVGTDDGVWTSADGGATWAQLNLNIGPNDQTFDVAVDPTNPSVLWAGVADAIGGQPINVLRSDDAGATWDNATPPLAAPQGARSIAINPGNPNNVAVGFGGSFGGGQVWVTDNGGTSWANRSAGLPNRPINDLEHDGARWLLAGGQLFGSQTVGVFASANNGATWTPLHNAAWPTLVINDLDVDPNNPQIIYAASATAGAFRTVNGGGAWEFRVGGTGSLSLNAVRFAPGSSTTIFLGANSAGVYRGTDAGAPFLPSSTGITALDTYSIAVNPLNAAEYAIAFQGSNNGGVFRTTDAGATWALQDLPGTRFSAVEFSPVTGTLYAISSGPSSIAPEGLYRRNPDGAWTGLGPNQGSFFESDLASIEFSRTDPNLIVLGGADFGVAGFEATIWRSDDAGMEWTKVYESAEDNLFVTGVEIVDNGADAVMVASFVDFSGGRMGGALRSTDGGLTWGPAENGLPAEFQGAALCASPDSPTTFYLTNSDNASAGASGGLFRTTDAGQSWAGTGYTQPAADIVCDPRDAEILYITQDSQDKALRSENAGASFSPFGDGLASAGAIRRLAFAGGPSPRLVAAASTGAYATALGGGCPADFNGDGTADVQDFLAYLNAFDAGDPRADFTGDGTVTVQDFLAFLNAFALGC